MTSRSEERKVEINRGLIMGGMVLISVGALLGAVGGVATAAALIGATRSWIKQWDEPPSAVARRRLAQARSAAAAGAQGWRQNGSYAPRESSIIETMG
jgi:hypothetical protein